MAPAKKPTDVQVYQIKVTLKHGRPAIWRSIQVTGHTTLFKLHQILQIVMGWTNSHLHRFVIRGIDYGEPDLDGFSEVKNERTARLSEVVSREKEKFSYEYDFGDGWEHEILVERILPPEPGKRYPVCLAGKRACPPEDCGGPFGYEEFLNAIQDPNHPEHENMLEWIGGSFDPEFFDLDEVNAALRHIR